MPNRAHPPKTSDHDDATSPLRHFVVHWTIDAEAANPVAAARHARAAQRRPGGIATVFEVCDDLGHPVATIDLHAVDHADTQRTSATRAS